MPVTWPRAEADPVAEADLASHETDAAAHSSLFALKADEADLETEQTARGDADTAEAAARAAVASDLSDHEADADAHGGIVHEETDPVASAALTAHEAQTTGAHNLATLLGAKAAETDLTAEVARAEAAEALKQDAATAATDTELATEATARAAADTAETSARQAADTSEATTRAAAITAEATARDGAIATHSALKRGVHGIPSSVGSGEAILGDGSGGWTATDVATQAELDSEAATRAAAVALLATKAQERLALAAVPDSITTGAITRDANGAATSAAVTWPDGTPGTYTATTVSTTYLGAVDAYTITYGSPATATYTQAAVTRDANGAVTNRPAITVS